MNLKQLEAFVKVTESGSFSKAAKLLFLTQPTVSAHISSLEKELDSRLFVRNTKEVKLIKNKLYKIVGRRKAIIPVCAPDGGTRKRNRAGIFQGCAS